MRAASSSLCWLCVLLLQKASRLLRSSVFSSGNHAHGGVIMEIGSPVCSGVRRGAEVPVIALGDSCVGVPVRKYKGNFVTNVSATSNLY